MQRRASSRYGATMARVGQTSMQARAAAAVRLGRRGHRQRQVDVDLAEEEHRAAVAIERERVLAAPADAAARGQLDLEHRRRVGEDAMAERPDRPGDAVGELLQAPAQDLVIVAAARIERDRRPARVGEAMPLDGLPSRRGRRGQVVEPRRDHAHRARHELGRAGAAHAVRGHVGHLAVEAVARARRAGRARPRRARHRPRRSGKIPARGSRLAPARAAPRRPPALASLICCRF